MSKKLASEIVGKRYKKAEDILDNLYGPYEIMLKPEQTNYYLGNYYDLTINKDKIICFSSVDTNFISPMFVIDVDTCNLTKEVKKKMGIAQSLKMTDKSYSRARINYRQLCTLLKTLQAQINLDELLTVKATINFSQNRFNMNMPKLNKNARATYDELKELLANY